MDPLAELLGESPGIVALRDQVRQLMRAWSAARRPPPVLLQGETGTGKGLLAHILHRVSPRASGPFVSLNCAAVPETLLEAELFGFERGAFTDARRSKPGLFQQAHRGTLFLDEIGLLPPSMQAKLLSALEDRAVRRLGAVRTEAVDVWVLAATNEDLVEAIQSGAFRKDLYHRVAVLALTLPPLRDRGPDIPLLAERFLARACTDYGLSAKSFAPDARAALRAYSWPGNIRELGNVIERAALLTDAQVLLAEHLSLLVEIATRVEVGKAARPAPPAAQSSLDVMRAHLLSVLTRTGGNISHTAVALGVSRNTVRARIARYGLGTPRAAADQPAAAPASAPGVDAVAVRGTLPMTRLWESRHLALLLVRLSERAEEDLSAQQALSAIADKIHGFGGRVEGLSPGGLDASFGLEPLDEPAVVAAHTAMVIHNAFRRGGARLVPLMHIAIGLHASEILVSPDPDAPTLDADGSRRAFNALDVLLAGAEPGTTLVTAQAAALLRRRFTLVPLEADRRGYRIEGLWRAGPHPGRETARLAGRGEELALLEGRLAQAGRNRSQVIDVVGEAGIGKSRLLLELSASAPALSMAYLEGRCSSATQSTPFYPVLSILHAACGTSEVDAPEAVRDKVAATARDARLDDPDLVSILARLLTTEPVPRVEFDPAQLKRRFFAAIRQLLVGLSHGKAPLLIAVEDLHWVDPTSEECLTSLMDAIGASPIFLITTYRPAYRPPWVGRSNVTQLALSPLSREDSLDVVRGVLGPGAVADDLVERILARAEGNPLFLEELARAALEHGADLDELLGKVRVDYVPATIEEVITIRMSRLHAQPLQILGVAAVIGRETPMSLLRQASQLPAETIAQALEELQRADFLYDASFRGPDPATVFKHPLVHEVAYNRLPGRERRALHARVLDAIERLYADRLTDHVEQLAHHAVMAEDRVRAVRYFLQAGQKAAARSALLEALNRLREGLGLVERLPEGIDRHRFELALQIAIGIVLRTSRGYASPESEQAFARARELCQQVGDFHQLGPVLVGQWFTYLLRAQYRTARELGEELRQLAERAGDPFLAVFAHRALGMTELFEGNVVTARRHLEQGLALSNPDQHYARAVRDYGGDPHVSFLAYLGRTLWSLGYPDQALSSNRAAVAHAQGRGRAFDISVALTMLTSVHQVRRDVTETREVTERALAHAREHGLRYWLARNAVLHSWAQAMGAQESERQVGIAAIRRSLEEYRATGATLGLSWFLTLLAQTYGASGEFRQGLRVLDEAMAHIDETGERYHEAEVHGLRGELLSRTGSEAEAEACFRLGLDVARSQQAKGWELRVAIGLARLLCRQGRGAEARQLLAPVHGWFTEGFDTADLVEARAMLDDLGPAR